MDDIKLLSDQDQDKIYRKLCETALRIFAAGMEEKSDLVWKDIFLTVLKMTNVKIKKVNKNFKVSYGDYCETISTSVDNENVYYKDQIIRYLNELDSNTLVGNKSYRMAYVFVKTLANNQSDKKDRKVKKIAG